MKKIILILNLIVSYNVLADETPFNDFSSLRVETNYSKVEISAQDSNQQRIRLLSNNNFGVGVSLVEHWDKLNTSNIKAQYNKMDFNPLQLTPIDNLSQGLLSLSVGHTYSVFENLRVQGSLIMGEELYIRSKDVGVLTIDKFSNWIVKAEMDWDIVNKERFSLGLNAGLDISAPFDAVAYENTEGSNYKVNSSLGYSTGAYGRKYFEGYSIEGSLFIKVKEAKTSITDQSITSQGINLRIAIPFGY